MTDQTPVTSRVTVRGSRCALVQLELCTPKGKTLSRQKKEYLKTKIDELETNSMIKNIRDLRRGISDFKKCYQPRTNIAKDEMIDLVTDCHSILVRWRNHFSQLFDVQGVSDVRQTEIYTAEPVLPEPSAFEREMSI